MRLGVLIVLGCMGAPFWTLQSSLPVVPLDDLLAKSRAYAQELKHHLQILDRDIQRLQSEAQVRRIAHQKGLISRLQLQTIEHELAQHLELRLQQRQALTTVLQTMLEIRSVQGSYDDSGSDQQYKRFAGNRKWDLKLLPDLEDFFRRRFGRELPISARGQTETHTQLGFNHEGRVDVALHPKSREGAALINLLSEMKLPFSAFDGPLIGSATGAHIHLGPPSTRNPELIGQAR